MTTRNAKTDNGRAKAMAAAPVAAADLKAGDIMTVGAATVGPQTSIAEAARLMLRHNVSGLPVVDAEGALAGIVTERDLLHRAEIGTQSQHSRWLQVFMSAGELAEDYVHAHARKVKDVMTRTVTTVTPETPLSDVVTLMERHGFKRVPVLRDGRVVGIVSRANFLLALSRRIDDAAPAQADDLDIRRRISTEINDQRWNPHTMIDIDVNDGVVRLSGAVSDARVRDAIRVLAENVPGVKAVEDEMAVMNLAIGYV